MASQHGIEGNHLERLRIAALLHDVGKIAVPDAILHKPTGLARKEQALMRDHVAVGADILISAGFVEAASWVLHHHENYDGTGYPDGLRGEEIPLEARIISVADAFEAMTGPRPYREQLTTAQALDELFLRADSQFDRSCVSALADVLGASAPPSAPEVLPTAPSNPLFSPTHPEPMLLEPARRAS
jgi:HD-GYP domain-containing protein (c-di-GMP phosphodiesterase class II)